MNLQGRVAIVSGGAGHIGSVMAEAIAELGAHVVVLDLDKARCSEVAKQLVKDYRVEAMPLPINLAKYEDVRAAAHRVLKHFGRIDVIVNSAALVGTSELKGWVTPFPEQLPESWRLAMEVNLTAPFFLVQACADALEQSGHGSVINIGSTYGVVGPDMRLYNGTRMGNPAAYAASKGGLIQITRWLATVMAPKVRVNSISFGGMKRGQPSAFQRRYVARTPLKRMAIEEDAKGAVAFLASDMSAYVTGHNLIVDGGWTAW